jgi:hypothetical protein
MLDQSPTPGFVAVQITATAMMHVTGPGAIDMV